MNNKRKKIIGSIVTAIALILVAYFLFTALGSNEKINKKVFEISHRGDDARTFTVDLNEFGYINEDNGTWAYLQLAPTYSFGLRFINVTIPQGAEIKDAYVQLYSIGGPGKRHPICNIYCDDVDNALRFNDTIGALNISNRIYTENSTYWNESLDYDTWINTPSIKGSIQEVINRENWSSGNALAVLFVTEGHHFGIATFQHFENGFASRLVVEWVEPK